MVEVRAAPRFTAWLPARIGRGEAKPHRADVLQEIRGDHSGACQGSNGLLYSTRLMGYSRPIQCIRFPGTCPDRSSARRAGTFAHRQQPFGISSNFRDVCAAIAPGRIEFFKHDWKRGRWNLAFLAGISSERSRRGSWRRR